MRAMITGAAGFIGSNLAIELVRRGHEVSGLDNMSHGHLLNLTEIADNPSFVLHDGDVRERSAIRAAADGCDVIVHLAAYKIPRYSDAYDTLMVNARGSEHVADVAAEIGARVVAASTSDVYGKNPNTPFSEEADAVIGSPHVRRWAYALSKLFEEQLLLACHERFGIDVALMRFFGAYGPHQHLTWWGGPQSVFIDKALDGEPLPIHGDGSQTRSFTYVTDQVDGIIAVMESEHSTDLVVNLGNTKPVTIKHLGELVSRLIRGDEEEPYLEFIPYETFGRYEDVPARVPDISRARELLGFDPKVDLEVGLPETIRWQIRRRAALGRPIKFEPRGMEV